MARWALFPAFALTVWPALAQPFQGQVGTPDQALLGEDWYLLTPSEMPAIPIEGVTVSVIDCEENCPAPVKTDAAGWFSIPWLGRDEAHLRFEPPACPDNEPSCEPLESREEVLPNGGRTVIGAKWPAGIEDTMLRYMPLVTGTIYIKWKGQIPGLSLNACGSASTWVVIIKESCRSEALKEHDTFAHELMHVYERRLRRACWHQTMEIDGWILQAELATRTYEADRRYFEKRTAWSCRNVISTTGATTGKGEKA